MKTPKTTALLHNASGGLNAAQPIVLEDPHKSGEDRGHGKTMFTVAKLDSSSYSNSPVCTVLPLSAEQNFQGESAECLKASRDLVGSFLFTDSVDGNEGTKGLNVSSPSIPI